MWNLVFGRIGGIQISTKFVKFNFYIFDKLCGIHLPYNEWKSDFHGFHKIWVIQCFTISTDSMEIRFPHFPQKPRITFSHIPQMLWNSVFLFLENIFPHFLQNLGNFPNNLKKISFQWILIQIEFWHKNILLPQCVFTHCFCLLKENPATTVKVICTWRFWQLYLDTYGWTWTLDNKSNQLRNKDSTSLLLHASWIHKIMCIWKRQAVFCLHFQVGIQVSALL